MLDATSVRWRVCVNARARAHTRSLVQFSVCVRRHGVRCCENAIQFSLTLCTRFTGVYVFRFFFFSSLSSVIVDNVVVIVIIIMFFFFSFCHSSTRFRRYLSQCFPFFQCTILESFVFVCVCHFRVSIHFLNITTSCKVITDAFRLSSKGRTSFEVQFICRNECSLY